MPIMNQKDVIAMQVRLQVSSDVRNDANFDEEVACGTP